MKKQKKLSVIIITRNEQEMIKDCLESIYGWADEIIIIDDASTDETVNIVKKYKTKITLLSEKTDFFELRNQGLKKASGDWVFYLDADERITPELKVEMKNVIRDMEYVAYAIPRRNFLLGKELHWGGWWPDYVKRLYQRGKLQGWKGDLHEEPVFKGELGYLKQPMIHITHRDLSSMVEKTKNWSRIEAQLLFDANHPPVTWWRILKVMTSEFWQRFIKYQAWRDGVVGWIEGLFQVFNKFLIYGQLWELQNQR
ncbi:glycosyltransferase family 2 protein [Patescibacteria group bacterium]|nr:glycosyltransferase family 2 protein [Patescibacteria group bacterium]